MLSGSHTAAGNLSQDGVLGEAMTVTMPLSMSMSMCPCPCSCPCSSPFAAPISGLRRTFLVAGARSVIAASWATADEPTTILSSEFYAALVADPTRSQAEALRLATKAVREAENGKWDHPAFWAAFSVMGAAKGL